MYEILHEKAPTARAVQAVLLEFAPRETYDYIFIPSGSFSLFIEREERGKILRG